MAEEKLTAASYEERTHRLLDLVEPLAVAGLYFLSVISWIYGLVFGVVATAQCKLEANKRVGKICIILAIVNFVLVGCLVAAYILIIIFAVGSYAFLASPSGGG
jgi:uncharacterized membrane protein